MKRILDRLPTPATLIASLALFVSLGGVSWGVATGFIDSREIQDETLRSRDIRNGEVRTQDLRNNEVRGRDIRNSTIVSRDVGLNGLNGSDILESSLGPVPQAEAVLDTTGFAPIPLGLSGSVALEEPAPQFDVDPLGYVHLQGILRADTGVGTFGTLPVGARPAATGRFAVYGDPSGTGPAPALVQVEPDGEIRSVGTAAFGDQLSLDGVTFRAAN